MTKEANTLPVNIADQIRADLEALNKMTNVAGGNKVTYEGRSFKLPGDGGIVKGALKAVILDFGSYNAFYDKPFDKNAEPEAPPCYAFSKFVGSLAPSAAAARPQAENCQVCPNNQFGSKGNGKACTNKRVLTALVVNGPGQFDPKTAPIVRIEVSATAIKHWDKYVKDVQHMFGVPPVGVITDIAPDESETYISLRFSNPVPNPALEVCYSRKAEAAEILERDPHVR